MNEFELFPGAYIQFKQSKTIVQVEAVGHKVVGLKGYDDDYRVQDFEPVQITDELLLRMKRDEMGVQPHDRFKRGHPELPYYSDRLKTTGSQCSKLHKVQMAFILDYGMLLTLKPEPTNG